MKKTNVLVEVDDLIYTNVIEPKKRKREFNQLITNLLELYYSDSYVREKITGVYERRYTDSRNKLLESIEEMSKSLYEQDILSDEAISQLKYQNKQIKNGIFEEEEDKSSKEFVTKEYLEKYISNELSDIKGMLKTLIENGVQVKHEEHVEEVKEDSLNPMEGIVELTPQTVEEGSEESEESKKKAADFLTNLTSNLDF